MIKINGLKRKLVNPALCSLALIAGDASAFELKFDDPSTSGFIDTTVSASVAMTTTSADDLSKTPSGRANIFQDAGEVYSAPLSFITDAGIRQGNWGAFARFGYLYDFEMRDGSNKCTNCSGFTGAGATQGALDGIPQGARNEYDQFTLYDLFIYGDLDVAGHPLTLRVGKQVINWGESNIMGGGLSTVINPENLAQRTTPGTEVKERLLPQEMVYLNFDITENTSLEAYYVWNWRRSQFTPVGSYFSPFDNIGPGFNPDLGLPGITKRGTDNPKNGGQWGIAIHQILEDFNNMDLGVYWVRSHAQQPFLQANYDPNGTEVFAPVPGVGLVPTGIMASYHEVFAEDQDTYAISLNGELGDSGVSFQTEVNMRENFWDTRECQNFSGLAGILGAIGAAPFPASWTPTYPDVGGIPGCETENSDVYTWLGNLTYSIGGGPFGSDKQSYLFDWQMEWTEGQSNGDPTDKTPLSDAGAARVGINASGVDQLDRFTSDFAWGYTIVAAYEYNNLFWNLNVLPTFVWVHQVEGYSSFNTGGLFKNQRTARAGVTFDYQGRMSLELAATWWPGKLDIWSDRDNVSATFKYSF
ncbi:MAG: DUF1302 domain-containing protein [Porticoccaceae bacterium]|nr:DUF1302 domain-containing protein [Porticoccaceae bacterium]